MMGNMQSGHSGFSMKYDLGVMRPKLPYQPAKARSLFGSGMIDAIDNEITGTALHCLEKGGNMIVVRVSETESQINKNRLNGNIPYSFFKSPQFRIR